MNDSNLNNKIKQENARKLGFSTEFAVSDFPAAIASNYDEKKLKTVAVSILRNPNKSDSYRNNISSIIKYFFEK
jgi:hypothetical protein